MSGRLKGAQSQFTYDFGINIAQQTVNRVTRLAGASLTLASAFYALNKTATEYNNTLRANALRFGGMLSTMRAMEDAQTRLVKGQSYFTMDEQMKGMNALMASGVSVKENLDWINKAAHATGKTFDTFAGAIASGIQGSMGALVDMGLLTQRAVRYFERYPANTLMRQQAILRFVKEHKGLQQLIKDDFDTIQDQMTRLKGVWKGFLQSVVGRPNDPSSLTGMTMSALKGVAEAFARNYQMVKQYGEGIGLILGWTIKQIGSAMVWLGRQFKSVVNYMLGASDTFAERMRSTIIWLEFWKLKVKDFFNEYGGWIKGIAKTLLIFWGLKKVFVISKAGILSAIAYGTAIKKIVDTVLFYRIAFGGVLRQMAKFGVLGVKNLNYMRQTMPLVWGFTKAMQGIVKSSLFLKGILLNLPKILLAGSKAILGLFSVSNPIGWILLAIAGLVVLYKKSEKFRNFINSMFEMHKQQIRLVWNTIMWLYANLRNAVQDAMSWIKEKLITPVKEFFSNVKTWISDMWNKFKDTSIGKWISEKIVDPIRGVVDYLSRVWGGIVDFFSGGIKKATDFFSKGADAIGLSAQETAQKGGYKVNAWMQDNGTTPLATTYGDYSQNQGTQETVGVNPVLQPVSTNSTTEVQPSTINLSNGAVQIIVHKGEGIDERKLAQQVKTVLDDMQRTNRVRTGG